jgi:hypothetical protein
MKDILAHLLILLAVVIFSLLSWVFFSCMEAAAYNRITNSSVTTWDAMWVELRVTP